MNMMDEARKEIGGRIEEKINAAIDKAFENDDLYQKIATEVALRLKSLIGADIALKVKANLIDLIDGEDDIPDVE